MRFRAALLLVGALAPAPGCTLTGPPGAPALPAAPAAGAALPVVERGDLEPDYDRLPAFDLDRPDEPPPAYRYRGLSEFDCQCLAVEASELGNLLEGEDRAQPPPRGHGKQRHAAERAADFRRTVRALAAAEARNRDAGTALELYYDLARAEASADVLRLSREELEQTLVKAKAAREQGIPLPVDYEELRRQRIELELKYVEAESAVGLLNAELDRRLRLDLAEPAERVWPLKEWYVPLEEVDAGPAVAVALQRRPELRMLRYVLHELDEDTLPAVRELLGSINGLLGSSPEAEPVSAVALLLLKCLERGGDGEVAARRAQVAGLLAERERAAAADVRQAVRSLNAQARQVALAREKARNWERHKAEVEKRVREGVGSSFELSGAVLRWHEARVGVIEEVVAWEKARVRLRRAQGVFTDECRGAGGDPAHGACPA
ncbi:MAG TPA: hypothetical protein VIL46_13440, partial [Gemmataceae bacterium]